VLSKIETGESSASARFRHFESANEWPLSGATRTRQRGRKQIRCNSCRCRAFNSTALSVHIEPREGAHELTSDNLPFRSLQATHTAKALYQLPVGDNPFTSSMDFGMTVFKSQPIRSSFPVRIRALLGTTFVEAEDDYLPR
jgi:hypothetical protein